MRISDWSSDVCSSDLLLRVLVIFIHREIDDPAEAEGVLLDQAQFLPNAGACKSGELRRVLFLACGEKYAVVEAKAKRCDQLCRAFLAVILGDGAARLAALDVDITKPCMAFANRKRVV